MTLGLAFADAKRNCVQHGATAILTLKSGITIEGKLERADSDMLHLRTAGDGWTTVLQKEVVAVGVRR